MKPMTENQQRRTGGRQTAFLALLVALATTALCVWREREIAQQNQIIRWQDSFTQLQPILAPLIGQKLETLRDQAKSTLRHENFSESSWQDFITATEWRSHFPGMVEIGYADSEKFSWRRVIKSCHED